MRKEFRIIMMIATIITVLSMPIAASATSVKHVVGGVEMTDEEYNDFMQKIKDPSQAQSVVEQYGIDYSVTDSNGNTTEVTNNTEATESSTDNTDVSGTKKDIEVEESAPATNDSFSGNTNEEDTTTTTTGTTSESTVDENIEISEGEETESIEEVESTTEEEKFETAEYTYNKSVYIAFFIVVVVIILGIAMVGIYVVKIRSRKKK